jgi:hypothetical protein
VFLTNNSSLTPISRAPVADEEDFHGGGEGGCEEARGADAIRRFTATSFAEATEGQEAAKVAKGRGVRSWRRFSTAMPILLKPNKGNKLRRITSNYHARLAPAAMSRRREAASPYRGF